MAAKSKIGLLALVLSERRYEVEKLIF